MEVSAPAFFDGIYGSDGTTDDCATNDSATSDAHGDRKFDKAEGAHDANGDADADSHQNRQPSSFAGNPIIDIFVEDAVKAFEEPGSDVERELRLNPATGSFN